MLMDENTQTLKGLFENKEKPKLNSSGLKRKQVLQKWKEQDRLSEMKVYTEVQNLNFSRDTLARKQKWKSQFIIQLSLGDKLKVS